MPGVLEKAPRWRIEDEETRVLGIGNPIVCPRMARVEWIRIRAGFDEVRAAARQDRIGARRRREAEEQAESDTDRRELAAVRNQAESLLYTSERALLEFGDVLGPAERTNL